MIRRRRLSHFMRHKPVDGFVENVDTKNEKGGRYKSFCRPLFFRFLFEGYILIVPETLDHDQARGTR